MGKFIQQDYNIKQEFSLYATRQLVFPGISGVFSERDCSWAQGPRCRRAAAAVLRVVLRLSIETMWPVFQSKNSTKNAAISSITCLSIKKQVIDPSQI